MKLPGHHQTVMPYLIVKDAEGFLKFIQEIFQAVEIMKVPNPDGGLMHAEAMIGTSTIMFAGVTEYYQASPINLFIYIEHVDAVYNKALAAGAVSVREPQQLDYGYSGAVTDPYGNTWWLTAP